MIPDSALSVCIAPMHTRLPTGVTVHGGVTRTGGIVVDRTHHGTTHRVVVGRTQPDDHNASAVHAAPGHLPIVAWNTHSDHDALYIRVGLTPGDVPVNEDGWLPTVALTGWPDVSYSQIHHLPHHDTTHPDGTIKTRAYLLLVRSPVTMWKARVLTVDQDTGHTTTTPPVTVLDHQGSQGYLLTATDPPAHADQPIRFAGYAHYKRGAEHTVYYGEINPTTLTITTPTGTTADLTTGDGLPLTRSDLEPVYTPRDGWTAWPLAVRGHPEPPAVLIATWDKTTLTGARYLHTTRTPTGWTPPVCLGPAGAFVGAARGTSQEQYTGGGCYPSPSTDRVYTVSEHHGSWALTEHTQHPQGTWSTRHLHTTRDGQEMYRPRPVVNGIPGEHVATRVIDRYASFFDYLTHVKIT